MAIATGLLLKINGSRPAVPWISYRATRTIKGLARKDWKILECGSGMSTLWLSQHCEFLHSIESNPGWHEKVKSIIEEKGLKNIKYELRSPETYADFSSYEDGYFDFVLIDGLKRDACVRNIESKVKPGGYIYLDNTDQEPQAEKDLLEVIKRRGGSLSYFTDFAPTCFHVTQGALAKF